MNDQSPTEPSREPGIASVEDGHVILDGPDGIAATLTPYAALKTGESLIAAARSAQERERGAR